MSRILTAATSKMRKAYTKTRYIDMKNNIHLVGIQFLTQFLALQHDTGEMNSVLVLAVSTCYIVAMAFKLRMLLTFSLACAHSPDASLRFPCLPLKKMKIVVILYYFLMLLNAAGHLIQFHNFIQIVSLLLSFFFIIGFDDAEDKVTQWQGNGAFSKTLTHIDCKGTPFFRVVFSAVPALPFDYVRAASEQASERMKWVREWNECMWWRHAIYLDTQIKSWNHVKHSSSCYDDQSTWF